MIEDTYIKPSIENNDTPVKSNIKGDKCNVFQLLVLYTLQGVPIGLAFAIPIIMQQKHKSSYNDQAIFSFAFWPYSMKLLWAPIVDSLYVRKIGRRKSWLIPIQYSLSILILVTGFSINEHLMNANKPNVVYLAVIFFMINLLVATQDIVVDGWALTMLKRENIGYAAMCNCAGLSFGVYFGFTFLIMLMSETFWNRWRSSPQPDGIVSLREYFYFWGVICIAITTLVAMFKTEKDLESNTSAEIRLSIVDTYKLLLKIMTLPNIKMLAVTLLTVFISFSPITAACKLKLIDGGITRDQIATIEFLYAPLRMCLPVLITRFTSEEKPLKSFFNALPYRLLVGVVYTLVIFFTPTYLTKTGPLLIAYAVFLVLIYFSQMIMEAIMFQTLAAFFTKISDPKIGGTIMTLLNTIRGIGISCSETTALWLIDILTFKMCTSHHTNTCSSAHDQNMCKGLGGTCTVKIDGFYVETVVCTIYGVVWYCVFRKYVNDLQSKNVKEWHVKTKIKEHS